MRIEQVQAFIEVAEQRSFAGAARHTGAKRSTLSAMVSALEDHLGVALFERSGNSLTLSPMGESILPDCYRLLTSAARIDNYCQQHNLGVESQLCIARDDALPEAFWQGVMHDIKTRFPLTAISVYLAPPQTHQTLIARQTVDIAFGLYTTQALPHYAKRLAPVDMRLVAAPHHPLSRLPGVHRDDLAQYTQICLSHLQDDRLVSEALFSANYLSVTMFELMRDAVIQGTGWALLPAPLIRQALKAGTLSRLPHELTLESYHYRSLVSGPQGPVASALLGRLTRFLADEE
ncbi:MULTISPECIES: LysR family transcriptional regulator [unclassified Halomonas]|uniref:LysR family transcriptional regulator n=1 Tax=unclassified Halomonas TaxID=2609666 RepID=UPI0020769A92|nr:LysR family transcriptional regulator [Halomonas sp. S3-1-8]